MHLTQNLTRFLRGQRRVEAGRTHTVVLQRIDLILHQGDQRRNYDRHPIPMQSRNLVAERFAAAGRHHQEDIFAGHHPLDDILLGCLELVKPKTVFRVWWMVVVIVMKTFLGSYLLQFP